MERQIITDPIEIKFLLISIIDNLVSEGKADNEGYVDCIEIGQKIADQGKALPKKLKELFIDFSDEFATKSFQKGQLTGLSVRYLAAEQTVTTVQSSHSNIPLDELKTAYNALPSLPPLGWYDFNRFHEVLEEQLGRPIEIEELKKTLIDLCPTTVFWNNEKHCYISKDENGQDVDIAIAFKAKQLKNQTVNDQPIKKITDNITIKKDQLKKTYAKLKAFSDGFRDFNEFRSLLCSEYNISISEEDLIKAVKSHCKNARFWKKYAYRGKKITAFKADSLKTTAIEELLSFAVFPGENGLSKAITSLAEKALPEKWHYGKKTSESQQYLILLNYLVFTFQRLKTEDLEHTSDPTWKKKIRISNNGEKAIFDTGLVNGLYDPIYAFFSKNNNSKSDRKWKFEQFVSSRDKIRQTLSRYFGADLPQPAHYYNDTSELIYNINWRIDSYNWDHFIDHCERLPISFLEDNVPYFDFKKTPIDFNKLAQHIKSDDRIINRIKNRIEDAIALSIKRVRWNFKTAIPIYYPGLKRISLLLPLSLIDNTASSNDTDVALVLEAADTGDGNGAYIAHTILTLQMAYTNARLITRPDSDWLTVENIKNKSNGEDSDQIED